MKLRGRNFTKDEIQQIKKLTKKHFSKGRTYISIKVCEALEWRQPNGWLKDRACREVLRGLDSEKTITLPKSLIVKKKKKKTPAAEIKTYEPNLNRGILIDIHLKSLTLEQVKGTKDEEKWNFIVNEHHYLGFKTFVGRSMKYLIKYNDRIIGAIGFCDPAFNLAERNELLQNKGIPFEEIKNVGINNGRFLILPWIKVPNLASYVLALSTKRVTEDWESYYHVKPVYIETFVDPSRFPGTCYKADNWQLLGKTKGYKKSGNLYSNSQTPKLIFIKFFKANIAHYKKKKATDAIPNRG